MTFYGRRVKMEGFITPPNHVNFLAKKLYGEEREFLDVAIAYMDKGGGGPTSLHTHTHDHLFIVTQGEAKIILGDKEVVVSKDESYLVKGNIPHSVWNNFDGVTVMIGITLR